jgi:hypothetical protein
VSDEEETGTLSVEANVGVTADVVKALVADYLSRGLGVYVAPEAVRIETSLEGIEDVWAPLDIPQVRNADLDWAADQTKLPVHKVYRVHELAMQLFPAVGLLKWEWGYPSYRKGNINRKVYDADKKILGSYRFRARTGLFEIEAGSKHISLYIGRTDFTPEKGDAVGTEEGEPVTPGV